MIARDYSPRKVDLLFPARDGNFFPAGLHQSEALLCAQMMRLVYCRREPDFQFDQQQIRGVLEPLSFNCFFFESTDTLRGMGTHAFLAFRDASEPDKRLTVVAFR